MNYNNVNFMLMADSYKYSHHLQTPPGTEFITSYACARGTNDPDYTHSIVFGMQMALKKFFTTPITMEEVEYAKEAIEMHGLPFNYVGWKYIAEKLDGKLPLLIEAVPEGTPLAIGNAGTLHYLCRRKHKFVRTTACCGKTDCRIWQYSACNGTP